MQRKVEPPSLDPAEEPLLWEGLTLNKCILVASVVALLSVTFQVLQGEPGAGRRGTRWPDPAATSCLLSLLSLLSSSAMLQGGNQPWQAGPSTASPSRWVRMLRAAPIPKTGPRPRVGWSWHPMAGTSHPNSLVPG